MLEEINSCSYQMSACLQKGPRQQEPSCLGIIGPVHSFSVRFVMALNFLSHLIKMANNILGLVYLLPPTTTTVICFVLTQFWPLTLCSVLLILCLQSGAICQFCNNLFNLFGQIKFFLSFKTVPSSQHFLLHWLPFAVYPRLSSCPFHLYVPFLVLHLSLLSSIGLFVLLLSFYFKISPQQELFFFYSSCSVLHALDTQYMFDDCELAVCRYPSF